MMIFRASIISMSFGSNVGSVDSTLRIEVTSNVAVIIPIGDC